MIGGIYFAGAPFAGMLKQGISAAALAAQATIGLTSTANLSDPPFRMVAAATTIDVLTARADLRVPIDTTAGIWIGGINVTGRVKVQGLIIHDILNDAPNTATFQLRLEAPAVGQSVRIQMGTRVLFTGSVQTVDQAYESKPEHLIWNVTAIDDTAAANRRRPFGTWFETSATTIAQSLTSTYAPGFSSAGIAAGLPAVTIVFDGADPFIACLTRLATAVGGYCKVEQGTVYLFTADTADPPAPIDDDHRFLSNPPIQVTTDSSQLRTRVYGKGYGENVPTDIAAGETLLPIQDGALFPALGGTAIVGLTADGAQSDKIAFSSVLRPVGGTLVGPGAAPANAPTMALAAGGVVTSGLHEVSVVHVTGVGKSLAGPRGAITTGAMPAPGAALTAGTAVNGTGPDQGSHDYVVTNLMLGGETTPGPASNAVTTSAASGQISPPTAYPYPQAAQSGTGVPDGYHGYGLTFVNAQGETQLGSTGTNFGVGAGPVLTGQIPAPSSYPTMTAAAGAGTGAGSHSYSVTFGDSHGDTTVGPSNSITTTVVQLPQPGGVWGTITQKAGGGLTVGQDYAWRVTFGDTVGETTTSTYASNNNSYFRITAGNGQVDISNIPIGPSGTVKRYLYRSTASGPQNHLVATINDNTTSVYTDGLADASVGRLHPGANTTGEPYHVVNLTNIPIGPAGTTNRKIWRADPFGNPAKYVGTLNDNLTTTLTDSTPYASLGATAPATNTTGQTLPFNQMALVNLQTGPAGTTSRRLYRQNNSAGAFLLVATISNNTETTYLDTKSSLGAEAPSSNTTGTAVQRVPLTAIPLGPGGTTGRRIYRRFNGAGTFKLVTELANNSSTTFNDGVGNSALGAAAPTGNTAVGNQINLSGIPTGGSSTTAREIYMTQVGGGTLRLALTIADNTTRDAVLNVADATLAGASTPPVTDTSGLQQPQGQVNPGSPTLIVASPAPFLATGGWVVTGGGQVIRYTGISGQLLTGVPASGPGAIVTTILYGQQALPAPMLTGVTGLARAMLKGSAVHIWIQRDDLQAQAEQAARTGGDGIVEFLIVDQRRGVDSLAARCVADLAQFSRPIITVSYATRDLKTKSGKTILVDLPSQGILQTLTIQDVTITELDIAPNLPPRFTVTASSVRFSLEDTLRRLITVGPVTVNT